MLVVRAGATSPFLNYHPKFAPVPYPAVICTSVNDAALHGIPGSYRLQEGDLLSVIGEVVSVSPEKRTKLGVGHFVETLDTFTRQDGAVVARNRNTLFRFTPGAPS